MVTQANNTSLSVYQRMPDATAAVKQLGLAIAKSQIFGCSNEAQGEIIALECMVTGEPPLSLAKRNHIIFGKLSMKADAMLAEFNNRNGEHEIVERTPEAARAKFTYKGKSYDWSFTWKDAQQEPFVYEGKDSDVLKLLTSGKAPTLKTKYATPRARMQMLWARLISDSVRAIMPGVNFGQYTPEEIEDIDDVEFEKVPKGNGNGHAAKPADVEAIMREAAARRNTATDLAEERPAVVAIIDQPHGEVVDAEFEIKQDEQGEASAPATVTIGGQPHPVVLPTKEQATIPPPASDVIYCSAPASRRIDDLFDALEFSPERRQANRDKFGGGPTQTNRNLTREQADKLIALLEKAAAAKSASVVNAMAGESRLLERVTGAPATGPCSQVVVDEIKALALEMNQVKPGSTKLIMERLKAQGKAKVSDLSEADAQALKMMLGKRNIDEFFTRSLETWEPKANGNGHAGEPTTAETETTPAKN